jgi:hypothetical protein
MDIMSDQEENRLRFLLWSNENRVEEFHIRMKKSENDLSKEKEELQKLKMAPPTKDHNFLVKASLDRISDIEYQIGYFTNQIASRNEEIRQNRNKLGLPTPDNSWVSWAHSLVTRVLTW